MPRRRGSCEAPSPPQLAGRSPRSRAARRGPCRRGRGARGCRSARVAGAPAPGGVSAAWRALSPAVRALVVAFVPSVLFGWFFPFRVMGEGISFLVHELGHTFVAWFFGCSAMPAIVMTIVFAQSRVFAALVWGGARLPRGEVPPRAPLERRLRRSRPRSTRSSPSRRRTSPRSTSAATSPRSPSRRGPSAAPSAASAPSGSGRSGPSSPSTSSRGT